VQTVAKLAMMKQVVTNSSGIHRDGAPVEEEEEGIDVVEDVVGAELAQDEDVEERWPIKCKPIVMVNRLQLMSRSNNLG